MKLNDILSEVLQVDRLQCEAALDALMAGHSDVHLHRNPDGTVSVTAMRPMRPGEFGAAFLVPSGPTAERGAWVDVEAGAS